MKCGVHWHLCQGHAVREAVGPDTCLLGLQVHAYDGASKHWKIINGWYGAHAVIGRSFGNSILGPVGSNSSTGGKEFEWPSGRKYSYPRVWVPKDKHANYRSLNACDSGGVFEGAFEDCANGVMVPISGGGSHPALPRALTDLT